MENARASLIDRLTDTSPSVSWEERPLRTLSGKSLRDSVARDLIWLLNTRTALSASVYHQKPLTVTDYGIPDFGRSSPANPDDREVLARTITKAISAFEPRLRNPRVFVKPEMRDEKTLSVTIEGVMTVGSVRMPVSFQTIFQKNAGTWKLI
jgi:type VI secretion system protein ImpF